MKDEDQQTSGINWISFCLLAGTIILFGVGTYFLLPGLISNSEDNLEIVKNVCKKWKICGACQPAKVPFS